MRALALALVIAALAAAPAVAAEESVPLLSAERFYPTVSVHQRHTFRDGGDRDQLLFGFGLPYSLNRVVALEFKLDVDFGAPEASTWVGLKFNLRGILAKPVQTPGPLSP